MCCVPFRSLLILAPGLWRAFHLNRCNRTVRLCPGAFDQGLRVTGGIPVRFLKRLARTEALDGPLRFDPSNREYSSLLSCLFHYKNLSSLGRLDRPSFPETTCTSLISRFLLRDRFWRNATRRSCLTAAKVEAVAHHRSISIIKFIGTVRGCLLHLSCNRVCWGRSGWL
jgi:hypothetical protein